MDMKNANQPSIQPPSLIASGILNPTCTSRAYQPHDQPPMGPFLPSAEYFYNKGEEENLLFFYGENDPIQLLQKRVLGDNMEQVYIGLGKYIDINNYNIAKAKKPKPFFRSIVRFHCSAQKLANRCLDHNKIFIQLPNTSPRKSMTPCGLKIIKNIFRKYMQEKCLSENEQLEYLGSTNSFLKYLIRDAIRSQKPKNYKTKAKKRLF